MHVVILGLGRPSPRIRDPARTCSSEWMDGRDKPVDAASSVSPWRASAVAACSSSASRGVSALRANQARHLLDAKCRMSRAWIRSSTRSMRRPIRSVNRRFNDRASASGRRHQALRRVRRARRCLAGGGEGQARLLPRSLRLRQDHAAARDRGPRSAGRGQDRDRRPRRVASAAGAARLRHRLPVLRAVSQPDRRRTTSATASSTGARARREIDRARRASCWNWSACPSRATSIRRNCPAGSSSASRWRARSPPRRRLLLLDEPLSALDARVRVRLRDEIKSLQRRLGVTTIMVTHDQEEALAMADRIVVMSQGRVEQVGTPAETYGQSGIRLRCRLCRRHEHAGRVVVGPGRVRIGRSSYACPGVAGPATAAAVKLGLRPEEVRIRGLESGVNANADPDAWRCWISWRPFCRATLAAGGRAGCRDRVRLLRQCDARSRHPAEGQALTIALPPESAARVRRACEADA